MEVVNHQLQKVHLSILYKNIQFIQSLIWVVS